MTAASADSLLILRNLISKDFKVRYRNMSLGILWSLINPLVMMGVLTFVFSVVFENPRENFSLFVLVGLLPYNFFSLAWSSGAVSLVGNAALVKKVAFRRELLPVSVVLAAALNYFIQLGLLLLATAFLLSPVNAPCSLDRPFSQQPNRFSQDNAAGYYTMLAGGLTAKWYSNTSVSRWIDCTK